MPWQNNGGGPWGGGGSSGGNGGGPQSPWGRGSGGGGRRPQQPDAEELIRQAQERLKRMIPGGFGGGGGKLIGLIAAVVVVVWLGTGFYTVDTNEQGVELVFGEIWETTGEGLNYNFPTPIGDVLLPEVTNVNQTNIGFRASGGTARNVDQESLMLTGDENIIDIQFTVFWRIQDAGHYLFNIRNPDETVKNAAESAMREIIGQTNFEYARTNGRTEVAAQARELIQTILNSYEAGVAITNIELQKVDPPTIVLDAFRDVQAAAANRESLINQATAYLNEVTNRGQGQAEQITRSAEAYKEEQINQAKGESNRFLAIYEEYRQAEDVTKRRIYLQTMENILANMEKVLIEQGEGGQGVLPYLPLDALNRDKSGRTNPLQQGKDSLDGSGNGDRSVGIDGSSN